MASPPVGALPGGLKHDNSARESQDRADEAEQPPQRLNGYATASYFPQQQPINTNTLDPQQRTESPSRQRGRPSTEQQQNGAFEDKPRTNGSKRTSKTTRICGKCGQGLTGQFVRALEDTFHLECFTCHVSIEPHSEICRITISHHAHRTVAKSLLRNSSLNQIILPTNTRCAKQTTSGDLIYSAINAAVPSEAHI